MNMTSNCDVTNRAHQILMTTIYTNDYHMPLSETPPWKFSAYATTRDLSLFGAPCEIGCWRNRLGMLCLHNSAISKFRSTTMRNENSRLCSQSISPQEIDFLSSTHFQSCNCEMMKNWSKTSAVSNTCRGIKNADFWL